MEVSFVKTEVIKESVPTPVGDLTVACETTVCHPQNAQVPAVVAPSGLALGDKIPSFDDVILPRLNIVQGTGELKDSFPQGAVVFGQSLVIFAPPIINAKTQTVEKPGTPPAIITVLGFRPTRFCEKVQGGFGGLICNTEAEVTANGGSLNYQEWMAKKASGMKRFEPLADALVVIERPEAVADDDTVFNYPCDGKKYTLALWGMRGTSYTAAAKGCFFTQRAVGCLRQGYPTYSFALSTRTQSRDGNSWHVPVCIPNKKSSAEFLAFAASILNSPA